MFTPCSKRDTMVLEVIQRPTIVTQGDDATLRDDGIHSDIVKVVIEKRCANFNDIVINILVRIFFHEPVKVGLF